MGCDMGTVIYWAFMIWLTYVCFIIGFHVLIFVIVGLKGALYLFVYSLLAIKDAFVYPFKTIASKWRENVYI